MRFLHQWYWRGLVRGQKEDPSFDEEDLATRIDEEVMGRMYQRYRHHTWSDIQELFPDQIDRERARVRVEFREYIFPVRIFLRFAIRLFPSLTL